jgi:hypothetical protein
MTLCAAVFFVSACTEVDDRLGAGLVPKSQKMEIEVTSPENGVKTFLYRASGVPSSRTGYAWIGRTFDTTFGEQTSSALVQFLPYTLPYSGVDGYGLEPIVDSARILLTLSGTRGKAEQSQTFDVWQVVDAHLPEGEQINRDSVYYTDMDAGKYRGNKLFTFTHSGKEDVAARLFPTAEGKEYLNSLVRLPWDEYTTDSLFLKKYRGFIITPAEGSEPAALYGADLTASGISLHVRNHDTLDVKAIYDTLTTLFLFRDTDQAGTAATYTSAAVEAVPWNNVSVNMTEFNYAGSELGLLSDATNGFRDTLPDSPNRDVLYVQSGGGVGAYLRFTDGLIDEIRNLRFTTDEGGNTVGKDIAINQAMMRIWLHDNTPADGVSIDVLDESMTRLGSYLDLRELLPIPDYQYATEVYQNQQLAANNQTANYTLPYNGYLNRSNAYYELNITSYIQQLAKEKEGDSAYRYISPAIFIAPEAYSIVGTGQTILQGAGGDKPITIRITYTIIEG